jgi:16S rRNA (guanine527-N7)-methyltransferase
MRWLRRPSEQPMPTLPESRIAELLAPYLGDAPIPPALYAQLGAYLDLLLRWNARTNLTAIRDAEGIVCRHFGEGLFCGLEIARRLPTAASMLDFGSGAGFPGLPIQLLLPEFRVTLAESQGKKASFLREAVRTLNLPTEVWAERVESMPPDKRFDAVTLRAVDNMEQALETARERVAPGGLLVSFTSYDPPATAGPTAESVPLPGASHSILTLERIPL